MPGEGEGVIVRNISYFRDRVRFNFGDREDYDGESSGWFVNALCDEFIRRSLGELTRYGVRPGSRYPARELVKSFVPRARLVNLTGLLTEGIISPLRLWYPSTRAWDDPTDYVFIPEGSDSGYIYILGDVDPDGVQSAVLRWYLPHTIAGLDGATVTTFPSFYDDVVVQGACAFAASARALMLVESTTVQTTATDSYRRMAKLFRREFLAAVAPARVVTCASLARDYRWQSPEPIGAAMTKSRNVLIFDGSNNDVPTSSAELIYLYGDLTWSAEITGLAGGVDGLRVFIYNATNHYLYFMNEHPDSSEVNRLVNPVARKAQLWPQAVLAYVYLGARSRWYYLFGGSLVP